jgi:hypothetical protein
MRLNHPGDRNQSTDLIALHLLTTITSSPLTFRLCQAENRPTLRCPDHHQIVSAVATAAPILLFFYDERATLFSEKAPKRQPAKNS